MKDETLNIWVDYQKKILEQLNSMENKIDQRFNNQEKITSEMKQDFLNKTDEIFNKYIKD